MSFRLGPPWAVVLDFEAPPSIENPALNYLNSSSSCGRDLDGFVHSGTMVGHPLPHPARDPFPAHNLTKYKKPAVS